MYIVNICIWLKNSSRFSVDVWSRLSDSTKVRAIFKIWF